VNVIRPDFFGACPQGTSKCSTSTSIDNTLCYPDAELADCPITFVKLVDSTEVAAY
jgi:hypothetical protein